MKRFLIVLLVNAERYWNQWGKVDVRDDVTVNDADVDADVDAVLTPDATLSGSNEQRSSGGEDPRHDADVEHPVTRMLTRMCTPLLLQESSVKHSSERASERASEREDLVIPRRAVQLGLLPEPVAAAEDRMGELAMVEPGRTVLWVRGHQPSRARR